MAWIESHQSLARHPKTKRLARAAGITIPAAIGHLHLLWWWALDYAQDGSLQDFTPEDIADAMEWDGQDANGFVEALINAGFLDEEDDGTLSIHDWYDYAGRLIEQREKNRNRMRKARSARKKEQAMDDDEDAANDDDTFNARSPHEQNTTGATVPNQPNQQNSTLTNSTEPNQTKSTPAPRKAKKAPDKVKYAEFVSMTNDEYTSLVAKFGEDGAKRCIEILDNYKGANGKRYKSDYRAILSWVAERYQEQKAKGGDGNGQPGNSFGKSAPKGEDWSKFKPSSGFKRANPDG